MLFNSLEFIIFFPIVLLVYFVIPKKARYLWLLGASYFFYMSWNAAYALLLLASTAMTYVAGRFLEIFKEDEKRRKQIVFVNLFLNFGILFLFKYINFAIETVIALLGKAHIEVAPISFDFLLPVGISFYIFQAVGYTMDVYRGKVSAEKNFFRYALFVSFFPQLVAGPIERSGNLLNQLRECHNIKLWNPKRIQQGALVMLYGYVLKMILADRMAIYVDQVFDPVQYGNYQGFTVLFGIVLFTLQIYCDFSGYTFIAIGAAKVMGFDLMNNFKAPYYAVSIKDFWDRWHISLSTWFRDYLYFPLGGSRKGNVRKYLNIMIVFTLSGLWHGAAWHYVLWGVMHGVMRVFGEVTEKMRKKAYNAMQIQTEVFSFQLFRGIFTFICVAVAWTFFRASSVSQGLALLKNGFCHYNPWVLFDGSLHEILSAKDWNVLFAGLLLLVLVDVQRYLGKDLQTAFTKQNLAFRWLVFYAGILAVVVFGIYGPGFDAAQFIYFQF